MSPWDELKYFQPVKQTNFTSMSSSNTAQTPLCQYNAQRVCLIFSAFPGAGATTVWINTKISAGIAEGMGAVSSYPPLIFTQKDHGVLVQQAWFGWSAGFAGAGFTVFEVLLTGDWPVK